jgi:hypothetical protein
MSVSRWGCTRRSARIGLVYPRRPGVNQGALPNRACPSRRYS